MFWLIFYKYFKFCRLLSRIVVVCLMICLISAYLVSTSLPLKLTKILKKKAFVCNGEFWPYYFNDDSFETCISGKDFESITPNTEEIASTRMVNTGFLHLVLDGFSSVYNADCWSADLFLLLAYLVTVY